MPLKRVNEELPPTRPAGARPLILYVEDEDNNFDIAARRLREKYQLERAHNSFEAFNSLRAHDYALILMDIELAKSNYSGIAITQILTNHFPPPVPTIAADLVGRAPPIIFVTAYTARYSKSELLAQGGADLIAKPVDFIALSLAMTRLIARKVSST